MELRYLLIIDPTPLFLYTYLLEDFLLDETLNAKMAFEPIVATHDNKILHYYANNGRFANEGFIQACIVYNQTINFCSLNIYFYNKIAESNISILQAST